MKKAVSYTIDAIQTHIHDHLEPGDRLPGEKELARQLDVSRSTVREALARLAEKGQVQRQWGVGTFVVESRPRTAFGMLSIRPGIPGLLATTGGTPSVHYFAYDERPADADLFPDFPNTPTFSVIRVFALDGVPVIAIRDRVVAEFEGGRRLNPAVLQAVDILVADMFAEVGVTFDLLDVQLRATELDKESRAIFDLALPEPVIETHAAGFDDQGRKILIASGIYRTRIVEFVLSVS